MHLHGLGDVLEDHRLHVLVAVLEECRLPLHDATGDFQQRLVADFQAADQPARFLQLRAQHRVIGGTADETGIALIDADARQARRIDVDGPAALGAADEHVRHDVLGGYGMDAGARTRLTGAHQYERVLHLLFGDPQLPAQQRVLLIGDLVEVTRGDEQRRVPSRGLRVQLPQLQLDAFTDGTRAYTRRIHRLHVGEHALDLGGARRRFPAAGCARSHPALR